MSEFEIAEVTGITWYIKNEDGTKTKVHEEDTKNWGKCTIKGEEEDPKNWGKHKYWEGCTAKGETETKSREREVSN